MVFPLQQEYFPLQRKVAQIWPPNFDGLYLGQYSLPDQKKHTIRTLSLCSIDPAQNKMKYFFIFFFIFEIPLHIFNVQK